jgi:hypothetical protein
MGSTWRQNSQKRNSEIITRIQATWIKEPGKDHWRGDWTTEAGTERHMAKLPDFRMITGRSVACKVKTHRTERTFLQVWTHRKPFHAELFIGTRGGGLQYLHRSPARRRRRRKGNPPVPGATIWPPCHWDTKIQRPGPPCWGFNKGLTTLLCIKNDWYEIQRSKNRMHSGSIF